MRKKYRYLKKIISVCVAVLFLAFQMIPASYAQGLSTQPLLGLPEVGTLVGLSAAFTPASIKAIKINPQNPLEFNFIIQKGEEDLLRSQKRTEYNKLIKYFLAALTIPEDDLWVNLSPYEQERIIPKNFSATEMGRDLLAQDYLLKQIASSLLNPEEKIGQAFWNKIYTLAEQKYNTTDIPIDTFNKIWIVPDEAVVYEEGNIAYLIKSHLKVMLEEDYLAQQQAGNNTVTTAQALSVSEASETTKKIIQEIIIPELEKEVNTGKHFANLRQITHSLILATWYKNALKEGLLAKVYVDQAKVNGIDIADKTIKDKIYNQYIESFKTGVFNYIKETYDPASQKIIPHKYFSGGYVGKIAATNLKTYDDYRILSKQHPTELAHLATDIEEGNFDNAMTVLNESVQKPANNSLQQAQSDLQNLAKYFPQLNNFTDAQYGETWLSDWLSDGGKLKGERQYVVALDDNQAKVIGGLDRRILDYFKLPFLAVLVNFKLPDGTSAFPIRANFKREGGKKTFPGGYAEFGISLKKNALREIKQELFMGREHQLNPDKLKLIPKITFSNNQEDPAVSVFFEYSASAEDQKTLRDIADKINKKKNTLGEAAYHALLKKQAIDTPGLGETDGISFENLSDLSPDNVARPIRILNRLNSSTALQFDSTFNKILDFKDFALLTDAHIPAVTKNINALSGEAIALKLTVKGDDEDLSDRIILESDIAGRWQSRKGVVKKVGYKNGHNQYEVNLKLETDSAYEFAYTFGIEQDDDTLIWINTPRGDRKYHDVDGVVRVAPLYSGRTAAITMEFAPVAKRAGLGDAVYEKFVEMAQSTDVTNRPVVVLPRFKNNDEHLNYYQHDWVTVDEFQETLKFNNRADVTITAQKAIIDGVEVYALNVDDDTLFNDLYENKNNEFYESVILSKAGLLLLKQLGLNEELNVIEGHDHHAALVSLYMRSIFKKDFKNVASVFAINNIGYSGDYGIEMADELGLEDHPEIEDLLFIPNRESKNEIQLLAAAVGILGPGNYASTVSPSYALEVVNTPFGFISDTRLKTAGKYFLGIMNGISTEKWNPSTDTLLKVNYSINQGIDQVLQAKQKNKLALQQHFSQQTGKKEYFGFLKEGSQRLTLGTNARLVKQKQMDILPEVIQRAREAGNALDLVIVGNGEKNEAELLKTIKNLAEEISNDDTLDINIVYSPFSEDNERRMLGGADALLMPSDFEPSGLGQLKALMYGTVPIVRWTGGLIDSVKGEASENQTGYGFTGVSRTFDSPENDILNRKQNTKELFETIQKALNDYESNPLVWNQIIENGMNEDVSWKEGAKNHQVIYQLATEDLTPQNSLKFNYEFTDTDQAMETDQIVGGIDLNPTNINLQIKRDANNAPLSIEFQNLDLIDINGLTPVIININPVTSLPLLLSNHAPDELNDQLTALTSHPNN
ncbi:glycogen synthase [Candidatus Omnitrophota bacterium]